MSRERRIRSTAVSWGASIVLFASSLLIAGPASAQSWPPPPETVPSIGLKTPAASLLPTVPSIGLTTPQPLPPATVPSIGLTTPQRWPPATVPSIGLKTPQPLALPTVQSIGISR
jgi:hypothetical protein